MLSLEQIHPLVIHFPIAFFISLFLLDLYAWAKKIPFDGRGGMANLSAGLALLAGIGATIAAIFGSLALDVATSGGVPEALTETHASLGGITANAFAIWGILRIFVWWRKFSLTRWMRPCSISPDHRAAGLWAYSGSTPAATTAG